MILLGCGGGGVGLSVSISLTPATISLSRGAVAQITAEALDSANVVVATPALAYDCFFTPASGGPQVACSGPNSPITVSSNGLICAGQWDPDFITCQTTDNAHKLLPLGTASISAVSATVSTNPLRSSTVVVTDHEPVDSVQLVPDPGNPTPGPGNPLGCFSQNGTPTTTPNNGIFTVRAFSNDPAACQRITGSPAVPCQVPSNTIGSVNWSVTPAQVATVNASTTVASDSAGVTITASTPGQGVVVGSIGPAGSTVAGSAPFITCPVASIAVQTSTGDTSFTAPVSSTVNLTPIVTDTQGIALDLTTSTLGLSWLTSQPALATVALGTVNTASPGTAEITAACLPPACNVNFVPPKPVYSSNAVTATITGTIDSTILVTTATPPACTATVACTNSNLIIPIDSTSNAAGSALTLPAGVQVNSMVMTPSGDPAFLGTVCANGTTGVNGAACSGLLRFDPTVATVAAPAPTIPGTALITDGVHVVVSDPAANQIFIATSVPGIEATPQINISSFIAGTGAMESGNTVTITTTAPHGFSVGQTVVVAGVGVAGYNGSFQVVSTPSPTTFTYTNSTTGLAASGGGYATAGVAAAISTDGSKIYIVAGGQLYIYESTLPLQTRSLNGLIDANSTQAVSFFGNGAMAYVADSAGDDIVASCSDMLFGTGAVPVGGSPSLIAGLPNAAAMVDANAASTSIDEIDVTANSPTAFGACPPDVTNSHTAASFGTTFTPRQLIVTPDSTQALILSDKGVLAYNVGTKKASVVQLTGGAQALSGGVTPDSASLYVGATDGTVHRVDLTKTPPVDAQSIAVSLCPTVSAGCNPDFVVVRPVATVATLTALAISPTNPTIGTSATQQFKATGTFSDKTTRDMTNFVTWTSSNLIVALIGPTVGVNPPNQITTPGLAKGLAAGVTTITASTAGVAASTTLTVN